MRDRIGSVLFLFLFLVLFLGLACSGGGGGGGGGGADVTIGLTTQGSATTVESGGNLGVLATVGNADNRAVTWALASTASPGGTLTPSSDTYAVYQAPDAVAAEFTVTVTATAVANPAKQTSIQLTVHARVRPPNASLLTGTYAFLVQGFDVTSGRGAAAVGRFTADGYGQITGGAADYWFGASLAGTLASLTGAYTVGDDHRGTLTLGSGSMPALPFHVALGQFSGGVAGKGGMVLGNPSTQGAPVLVLAGTLWRQAAIPDLASIAGPYAFLCNGWIGTAPRTALGGTVTADGAGGFAGGVADAMTFGGVPVQDIPWTGTLTAPSAAGRAVLAAPALTGAGGSAVLYPVDAGHLLALITDPTGAGRVLSGEFLAQAGPFGPGSLDGTLAVLQTANYLPQGYQSMTAAILSLASSDGAGNLALVSVDQNAGINLDHGGGSAYTYTLGADGRAALFSGATDGGRWLLTGPNQALMLGFDPGVSVGLIRPQTGGPFSAASLSGSYFAVQQPGASVYSMVAAGVASADGAGHLALTLDTNEDGAVYRDVASTETVTVGSDGVAFGSVGAATTSVIYLFSPDRFARFTTGTAYPSILLFER